jgi:molybdopterin-guanine dinucleotide biosynthesis protein A
MHTIAGIFVGGGARRMQGVAKGLLVGGDRRTLIARWLALFSELGVPAVLVGEHAAYRDLGVPSLPDQPTGVGPIGGLIALLEHATGGKAVAVACDMPWVSRLLAERLLCEAPCASVLAGHFRGQWQPFLARYDASAALPVARRCLAQGQRSLQQVLIAAEASALELSEEEVAELRDWDTRQDVIRDGGPWFND